jgi:mRNA-degrading endonuclease RelE of RelBE toxin-antitoxin system/predicted transcriptional regulator
LLTGIIKNKSYSVRLTDSFVKTMRTTETMTVSLPPALVRQFEEVRKRESRTRSELVREALRVYFESRYPAVEATNDERLVLRRGRAALRNGDAVSLKDFLHGLEHNDHGSRSKRLRKLPQKEQARVKAALLSMESDPFKGDLKRLKGRPSAWRKRVGNYRIIYGLDFEAREIVIHGILRRTTTTYE